MIFYVHKVCDTAALRAEGLQFCEIGTRDCCLFIYPTRLSPTFWGKNTPQDLWVSLIDEGIVIDCKKIRAFDLTPVSLDGRGDMAVETRVPLNIGAEFILGEDMTVMVG